MRYLFSVFILFYSVSLLANEIEQPNCNYETIQKFCKKVKENESKQMYSKSPFQFSGKNADGSRSEMIPKDEIINQKFVLNERRENGQPLLTYSEQKRFQDLWKKTKKYARESILQGREESELAENELNMLARIDNIKLSDLTNPADNASCFNDGYYAYVPQTNSVVMCPIMAKYPDSALIWNMGAFMGRSMGSCLPKFIKPKYKGKEYPTLTNDTHPFRQKCTESKCNTGGGLIECLKEVGYNDNTDFNTSTKEAKDVIDFIIGGMIGSKEYPLPFEKGGKSEILSHPANREHAKKFMTENRECYVSATDSRVDAGVQDWFGADVAARYLEDHPIKAKKTEDYLEPVAAIADFHCRFDNAENLNKTTHAPPEVRFAGIFSNPRLRQAMNCNPSKSVKKNCTVSAKFKVKSPIGDEIPNKKGSVTDGQL